VEVPVPRVPLQESFHGTLVHVSYKIECFAKHAGFFGKFSPNDPVEHDVVIQAEPPEVPVKMDEDLLKGANKLPDGWKPGESVVVFP